MTNRKETLIEALHGSFRQVEDLPGLIDRETIYDESGHVDTALLEAILTFMSRMAGITNEVNKALARLLGITEETGKTAGKEDAGSRWSAEEILRHCTLEGGVMKLPGVQFSKKSYAEAKKRIEEAGGRWTGGKVQGFTFPFAPERVFSILHEGGRCNLAQEYQFFETPPEVADWLVALAGGIRPEDTVLEPSAGRGALVRAIRRACPGMVVDCYEAMPENREILSREDGIRLLGCDFTRRESPGLYSKIIANPPFSGNQDIDHVRMMYDLLEPGGTLASITSAHWEFAHEKACEDFRQWLEAVGGHKYEIEPNAFKESGTAIRTLAVVIGKER